MIYLGPGFNGPPPGRRGGYEYEKVPLPKGLGDLPRYLRELLGGFFYRLFYTFVLVWKTDPLILFTMLFISVFDGVTPIIGSLITARHAVFQGKPVYAFPGRVGDEGAQAPNCLLKMGASA